MNHRICIALAAASATCVLALAVPAAHASDAGLVDVRPCVTGHELWGLGPDTYGMPRRQVERRWEVARLGERVSVMGESAWAYPRCDSDTLALAYFDHGGLVGTASWDAGADDAPPAPPTDVPCPECTVVERAGT